MVTYLERVAERVTSCAAKFGAAEFDYWAGLRPTSGNSIPTFRPVSSLLNPVANLILLQQNRIGIEDWCHEASWHRTSEGVFGRGSRAMSQVATLLHCPSMEYRWSHTKPGEASVGSLRYIKTLTTKIGLKDQGELIGGTS